MQKRNFLYLLTIIPHLGLLTILTMYNLFHHGIQTGLYLTALCWSFYVLAIPAAHGSVWIAVPLGRLFHRHFYPEPYLWCLAVITNLVTMLCAPQLYHKSMWTFMLYRLITLPKYWVILGIGALGTWLPVITSVWHEGKVRRIFRLVRYLITLVGLAVLFYLMHQEFVILINTTLTG